MTGSSGEVTQVAKCHGDAGRQNAKNTNPVSVTDVTNQKRADKRTGTAGFCNRPNSIAAALSRS